MYTYVLVVILLFIITSCIKTQFPKKFILFGSAVISMAVCVIVNCVYFGANYKTMQTEAKVKTVLISQDNFSLKIRNDSLIRIESDNTMWDLKPSEFNTVVIDSIDKLTEVKYEYVDNNNWVMISSYPYQKKEVTIGLKKDKYDLFKTYQDSISKRKSTLQENG